MSALPRLSLPFVPDGYVTPCASADPEKWFPETFGHHRDMAVAICNTCPLKQECDDYAMERPYLHGIWGGRSRKERGAERGVTTEINEDPWGIDAYIKQDRAVPPYNPVERQDYRVWGVAS